VPGKELDDFALGDSGLSNPCMAETLWDAAERQGKNVILINYPVAWTDGGQLRLGERDGIETTDASVCDLALVASGDDGFDTLPVCLGKDASKPVATLKPGEWTQWIYADYGAPHDERGACRYKLIELALDGLRLTLYRTPIVSLRGYAHPESLCAEIVENVGPFLKGFDAAYNPIRRGDEDTAQDHIRMGVTQYVELTAYLAGSKPWDILITRIQFPDHLNHEYVRAIEPTVSGYDPSAAEAAWRQYRLAYAQADRFVGEIIERCADEDTLVVVLSDHAAFPMERNVDNLDRDFLDAGLPVYEKDDEGGVRIDWSKTRACLTPARSINRLEGMRCRKR